PRAPVLRARRPRHGDRLRPREPRALHAGRGARLAGAPGAHRPVPRGRGRGGRGRGERWKRGRDRRHHGAHRARRRALGRQRLLAAQGFTREIVPTHVNVKEAVFPFIKFPGVDTVLGPEMKSTGEVMGIDGSFGAAFAKAQIAASMLLPSGGRAFISVPAADYAGVVPVACRLARAGFTLLATRGTAGHLRAAGLTVEVVNKVSDGG